MQSDTAISTATHPPTNRACRSYGDYEFTQDDRLEMEDLAANAVVDGRTNKIYFQVGLLALSKQCVVVTLHVEFLA
jgi:hypothetical protein